jgi:hypothetical protein
MSIEFSKLLAMIKSMSIALSLERSNEPETQPGIEPPKGM